MQSPKPLAQLAREIEAKIQEIFDELDLSLDDNYTKAYKIFSYIVNNVRYDESIMAEKSEASKLYSYDECIIRDIYRCLCENRAVCTSEADAIAYMYQKLGIPVITMIIKNDQKNLLHEIVVCELNNRLCYCDSTLVREMIEKGIVNYVAPYVFKFDQKTYFQDFRPGYKILSVRDATDVSKFIDKDNIY